MFITSLTRNVVSLLEGGVLRVVVVSEVAGFLGLKFLAGSKRGSKKN